MEVAKEEVAVDNFVIFIRRCVVRYVYMTVLWQVGYYPYRRTVGRFTVDLDICPVFVGCQIECCHYLAGKDGVFLGQVVFPEIGDVIVSDVVCLDSIVQVCRIGPCQYQAVVSVGPVVMQADYVPVLV